ncbi:MAG: DUF4190 domain-containing protein [Acidimicrobiia bacterium]|nr:DUF4190 domain-containing protein [Acidimicrobiia bacterium]
MSTQGSWGQDDGVTPQWAPPPDPAGVAPLPPGTGPPPPGGPPPGWNPYPGHPGPSGWGVAPGIVRQTNNQAVWSLVLGILSVVTCPLTAVAGLPLGVSARRQIRDSQGTQDGDGLALAGIITSIVGLVMMLLTIAAFIFFFAVAASFDPEFEPRPTPTEFDRFEESF